MTFNFYWLQENAFEYILSPKIKRRDLRKLQRGVTANLFNYPCYYPKKLILKLFPKWIPEVFTKFLFLVNNGVKLHKGKYQKSINLVVQANLSHLLSKTFTFYDNFPISRFCLQMDKI